ncbi:MAG: transcriptional regulator NrdR [archaeon]|nr:transcriptional regulator NrdR [archaeon]
MLCPYCSNPETKVLDKRDIDALTKRRRECLKCKKRFNTAESLEHSEMRVIKKSGNRESFDAEKLKGGIIKACEKRPITDEQITQMMVFVEEKLKKEGKEIKSEMIGKFVSNELKKLDKVAYIRFASVYKDFTDVSDFKKEIRELKD